MNNSQPFRRANLMFSAIALIAQANLTTAQQQTQIAQLGPYISRGKGSQKGQKARRSKHMDTVRAARKLRNKRR